MLKEYQDFYTIWVKYPHQKDATLLTNESITYNKQLAFLKAKAVLKELDDDAFVLVRKCSMYSTKCEEWIFEK